MKNLKRTNTNHFQSLMIPYLIDCLRSETTENSTDKEVLTDLLRRFKSEYCNKYNLKMYPNHQTRLANWLTGLPTNLPFESYKIIEDAKRLHETNTLTEKEKSTVISGHWMFWSFQIIRLAEKHKLSIS